MPEPIHPLSPAETFAESLDPVLFAQHRDMALDALEVASLRQGEIPESEGGTLVWFHWWLTYGPGALLHRRCEAMYSRKKRRSGEEPPAGSADPLGDLTRKLEELAARSAEAPSQNAPGLHRIDSGESEARPRCDGTSQPLDLADMKSEVQRLERKERAARLSGPERDRLQQLRVAVRTERDRLRDEIAQRSDDRRDLDQRRRRDRLAIQPTQDGWTTDTGIDLVDDAGTGLDDLMGGGDGF